MPVYDNNDALPIRSCVLLRVDDDFRVHSGARDVRDAIQVSTGQPIPAGLGSERRGRKADGRQATGTLCAL